MPCKYEALGSNPQNPGRVCLILALRLLVSLKQLAYDTKRQNERHRDVAVHGAALYMLGARQSLEKRDSEVHKGTRSIGRWP